MIHLHVHDAKGSLLDSTNKPEELPARAKELNMTAVAVTNHGTMYSIIDFYKACRREGVKPILGCELYICNNMKEQNSEDRYDHLVVLAKSKQGYKNLLKLVGLGFTEGFYYKPRVDFETLEKHKEGLVITTACLGGEIPRMILKEKPESEIISKIYQYANTFENFYLEVQSADNPEQKLVNQELARLSKVTGVPIVVTSDVHFLRKEDYYTHGVFIQINQERDNEFYADCWMKSEQEVFDGLYEHMGLDDALEAITNTHVIADMCNVEIELGKSYLPKYPIPAPYKDEDEYIRHLINKGFKDRGLHKLPTSERQIYINRLKEEFDVITVKGYSGYFLIVQDFLRRCKERNIYTGDGRGSADNSLVCYVLGITNVDPILYDLNFSRFLTLERVELPDIDMDIQSSKKQVAVNILREVYGYVNVAQICTFPALQAKAIIDAIGKILNISYAETTSIKKYIPDITSLEKALKTSDVLAAYREKYPELFELALRLEGLPRSISVHAGGVVICPSDRNMEDFTALALSKEKEVITQLEMHNVEEVGLVKMDVLATITLDVIADSLDLVFGEE